MLIKKFSNDIIFTKIYNLPLRYMAKNILIIIIIIIISLINSLKKRISFRSTKKISIFDGKVIAN